MNSGNALHILCTTLAVAAFTFTLAARTQAQTESVLYSFSGRSDGADPSGGLVADAAGNLYGTTFAGGDLSGCGGAGCGVVYKLSPSAGGWTETVLHSFTGGGDGANPASGVIFDAKGNLYGMASAGGKNDCPTGCGVVFQLSPTSNGWTEKPLYNFAGGTDGFAPYFGLTFDAAGNLYGTALSGGNLTDCPSHTYGCGVAFKLWHASAGWTYQVLYAFTDSDSSSPSSGLILDAKGQIFGTGSAGYGMVYRLIPQAGKTWTDEVLYEFQKPNGSSPGGLLMDTSGNLFGPTYYGGTGGGIVDCEDNQPGCGTAFQLRLTSSGYIEDVLYNFAGQDANPNGSLVFDAAGNLYGVDSVEVFELTRRNSNGPWKKTALHTFSSAGDGADPRGPVLLNSAGDIFGVTYAGGLSGYGTVFEITR